MAVPFVLFPYAQERIDSSLAGMINAAAPLFAAVVAAFIARALPSRARVLGLLVGFAGVVAIMGPELSGAEASGLGVGLVLLATILYGFSFNITGPLQQRNGALPVIWRAQLVALVIDLPIGIWAVGGSEFAWDSLIACVVLGAAGTALAYVWFSVLVGRVGATPGVDHALLRPGGGDRARRRRARRDDHDQRDLRHRARRARRLRRQPQPLARVEAGELVGGELQLGRRGRGRGSSRAGSSPGSG